MGKNVVQIAILRQMFMDLDEESRNLFLQSICHSEHQAETIDKKASIDSFLHEKCKGVVKCPYCTSGKVVKWSVRKDGTRRYKCKDCRHTFVLARNTVFYYAKKDLATFALYAETMKEKTVIRRAAGLCRIGKKTSFLWRHKILDSLRGVMDDVKLDGIVEADEAFFPISYKGSRCLPRAARRRGGPAKKPGLSSEKVCVPCAVNRGGKSVSAVSNLGKVSRADLENVFCTHVVEGAVWCSDKEHSYQGFAEKHSLSLIQFKSDGKKTCGMFHIQHVNAYHSQLKSMIVIISIDVEKAFDKIQHPFMIKTLQKAGIEGTYLNIIKSHI